MAHSALGASKAAQYIACPGSVAFCENIPEPPPGPHAAEGTLAHKWLELFLANGENDANGYVGLAHPTVGKTPLSQEMAAAVQEALDYIAPLVRPEDDLRAESRVTLDKLFPGLPANRRLFGTADCIIHKFDGHLHVIDYKHGAGVAVDGGDNPQLRFYALGALLAADRPVTGVTVAIVQPRAPGPAVKTDEFDVFELRSWGATVLRPAVEAVMEPGAPLVAGAHCAKTFCKGRPTCPAFAKAAHAAATDAFGVIADPPGEARWTPAQKQTAETALQSPDFATRLRGVDLLEDWCAAMRDHAANEAAAGRMPAGFKYVRGRGRRAWTFPDEIVARAAHGLTGLDISEVTTLSPAQAEERLGKALFAKLANFVETQPGKLQLAPLEDARPAVDTTAEKTRHFHAIP